jgi:hypothetical protein
MCIKSTYTNAFARLYDSSVHCFFDADRSAQERLIQTKKQ